MKVGVVIITYNNAHTLAETIQSVCEQDLTAWTGLIVDNGSADDSASVAERLTAGDSRFRVIRKSNEGPSAGRNRGFAELSQPIDYVHFLDGDDLLKPAFLSTLTAYLDEHPEVCLLGCQFDQIDAQGNPLGPGLRTRYAPGLFGFPRLLKPTEHNTPLESFLAATGQGPFAVFRADVFASTDGYDESLWTHEDSDMFCQMALRSKVHYLPDRLYVKRAHAASITASHSSQHHSFRDKWDLYGIDDSKWNARIEAALSYYYGKHAPMRDLKVALLSFRKALRQGSVEAFRWGLRCLWSAFGGLVLKRTVKRLRQKRALAKASRPIRP